MSKLIRNYKEAGGGSNTLRPSFFTTPSLKCGNCKNGAIPSLDPADAAAPDTFLALNGTA